MAKPMTIPAAPMRDTNAGMAMNLRSDRTKETAEDQRFEEIDEPHDANGDESRKPNKLISGGLRLFMLPMSEILPCDHRSPRRQGGEDADEELHHKVDERDAGDGRLPHACNHDGADEPDGILQELLDDKRKKKAEKVVIREKRPVPAPPGKAQSLKTGIRVCFPGILDFFGEKAPPILQTAQITPPEDRKHTCTSKRSIPPLMSRSCPPTSSSASPPRRATPFWRS